MAETLRFAYDKEADLLDICLGRPRAAIISITKVVLPGREATKISGNVAANTGQLMKSNLTSGGRSSN